MSLQYIIDGYNLIHHRLFTLHTKAFFKDQKRSLLEFISSNRLCGSARNAITVVFDGYPDSREVIEHPVIKVIFSCDESADARIAKMLEVALVPKQTIVVSDDKEIRLCAKGFKATPLTIEEFIAPLTDKKRKESEDVDLKLSYSKQLEVNKELKKIWLR